MKTLNKAKNPKNVSTIDQGTQTDGVYEITSMKKEGLKFLVSRIYNFESKPNGCTQNYKLCSIADHHFFLQPGEEDRSPFNFGPTEKECTDADCTKGREYKVKQEVRYDRNCSDFDEGEDGEYHKYQDDGHELCYLSFKAMKYHIKIQRRNRNEYGRWDCETSNYEKKSANPLASKKSKKIDKVTQYGEDNPDEDFFEGAKFMATKILERESTTQRQEHIFYDDSFQRDTCDRCIDGCECPCDSKVCICGPEEECDCEPEEDCYCDLNNSANMRQTCYLGANPHKFAEEILVCDEYSKECDCENCNCAENQKISSENYQKYRVWRSQTPGELVEELAKKVVLLRNDRYLP